MVSINPQKINLTRPTNNGKETISPQKPTLQQMIELYSNWCSFSIPYFPPQATTAILKNRAECMEKYIKDNNLDIDVQNLELFFGNVKEKTGNMGGLSGQQAILKMLQDYIENGYNPNLSQDKLEPSKPDLSQSYKDNLEYVKDKKPSIEDILKIKNSINNDFDVFK